ncbi:SWIM zinc finger family protein [Bremerella sp. JC817]|uniref:SWIM zinc finger family protein n=1 Tax=Bremerella sp. JC817 TaxID=3231756 RepID=UPI003459D744
MISIDEDFIAAAAPNAAAANNGRGLVLKNKFVALHHSDDNTLLFGECQGSGKTPYHCSADFTNPAAVTYRCSCPSRQFPCKHSLGLLYAYVDGKSFTPAEVPESLASKREKAAVRAEKKKVDADKPRKVNKSALAKKIKAQLEGLDLLEKLTLDLVRLGIGNMNAKSARDIEKQAKRLGDSYLPGAQTALHHYTKLFFNDDEAKSSAQQERIYSEALDQLGRLHSLVKQGRNYLNSRLDDPELAPEIESAIAAWLGHAWQLRELKDAGLVQTDVELVQLSFNSYDDVARREWVDTGTWMNLKTGAIQLTQNFRPYSAAKYIKEEDSFFQVAQVSELCVYPGDENPRVRWETMTMRPLAGGDFPKIQSFGHASFADVIKKVKTQLKSPLADRLPVYALNYQQIGQIGDKLVAVDAKGERLVLTEQGLDEEPNTCSLLPMLPPPLLQQQTLIARFRHDLDSRKLEIKPLSIVSRDAIHRLTY